MILRNEKRKRKSKKDECEEDDEKYVAYKKKTRKSSNHRKADKKTSSASNSSSPEKVAIKKGKKKNLSNNFETTEVSSENNKSSIIPTAIISAKPKINKAVKLNAAINTREVKKPATKKKKNSKSNMSRNHQEEKHESDDNSCVELITPRVRLDLPIDDEDIPDFLQSDVSSPDPTDYTVECMVIEANLKKSTNSYLPKILQDDEDTKDTDIDNRVTKEQSDQNIKKALTKDSKDTDKNKKVTNEPSDKNIKESNNSTEITLDDSNNDIPQALQSFYDEVTRGFESLTEKSSKGSKKSKKKVALSVDESVKDSNLVDIVQKSSSLLDNLNLKDPANVAQFFSLENKVILVLWPETQFSFLGKLKLKVLYGAVELYGSVFDFQNTVKPIEIYSPRGYSSISISTCKDGIYDKEVLWDALISEGVDRSLKTKLHDVIQECKKGWSVILLENFENTLTNFLSKYSSFKLFPRMENLKYSWCDPKRAECVLQANFQFWNSDDQISISPQWNETVTAQLQEEWKTKNTLCAMVTGGKNVGKSTTARYLINNFLKLSKKVVLLDLDPGQAELTPAACVSLNIVEEPLLGPNFTHLKTPFYQLYLEDISVTNCITRYIECVKKLIKCLKSRKDLAQYPVIVNTMGFCKGIGLDICIFLIKLICPTDVIQILSKRPKNNFDFALLKQTVNERKTSATSWDDENTVFEKDCDYTLHYISSVAEGKRQFDAWNIEPRQQREVVLLSYLSEIIKNADSNLFCNFTSNSINNIIPYELPFSSFYISLIKANTSPTHILAAMNGNVVALCGLDLDDETSSEDRENLSYPMVVIKAPACPCYGYGIVRGIDMKRRCIYINTPLQESQLRHVNFLTGCSAVPFSLLQSLESTSGPYAGDRGELPTSREARRGYFRVDQNKTA